MPCIIPNSAGDEDSEPIAELARGHHDNAAKRILLNESRDDRKLEQVHRDTQRRGRGGRVGVFKGYACCGLDKGREEVGGIVAYHANHQAHGHGQKHEAHIIGLTEIQTLLALILEQKARQEKRNKYAENRHHYAYGIAAVGAVCIVVKEIQKKQYSRADKLKQGEKKYAQSAYVAELSYLTLFAPHYSERIRRVGLISVSALRAAAVILSIVLRIIFHIFTVPLKILIKLYPTPRHLTIA